MKIAKYFGLGILGSVAVSGGIVLIHYSDVLLYSYLSESDKEYQFLYKLAEKAFPFLREQNRTEKPGELKAIKQNDLIPWLIAEFELSNYSTSNTWRNFKNICEIQKKQDLLFSKSSSNTSNNVKVPASRFCWMDEDNDSENKYGRGVLGYWGITESGLGYNGFNASGSWPYSNLSLWKFFKAKFPNKSPLWWFDAWYNTQNKHSPETQTSGIKSIIG